MLGKGPRVVICLCLVTLLSSYLLCVQIFAVDSIDLVCREFILVKANALETNSGKRVCKSLREIHAIVVYYHTNCKSARLEAHCEVVFTKIKA